MKDTPQISVPSLPPGCELDDYYYRNDIEYLKDIRILLDEKKKCKAAMAGIDFEKPALTYLREQIQGRRRRSREQGIELRFDRLAGELDLNGNQEIIIAALAVIQACGDSRLENGDLLRLIAEEDLNRLLEIRRDFQDLRSRKLVSQPTRRRPAAGLDEELFEYIVGGGEFPVEKFTPRPEETGNQAGREENWRRFKTPRDIYRALGEKVVGQEAARISIAVAAFTHVASLLAGRKSGGLVKPNILLAGPTGCGKTHLALTLAGVLNIPYAVGDATTWTEEGYVGPCFDEVLWRLYESAGYDLAAAERGLIYIDEVDKLARPRNTSHRGVGDVSVQRALLKALEGSPVQFSAGGAHNSFRRSLEMDTSGVMFVLGGAFTGIEELTGRRNPRPVGFGAGDESLMPDSGEMTVEDLVEYGFLREFVGRIPIVAPILPLTKAEMVKILDLPKTGLVAALNRDSEPAGIKFLFTPAALRSAAAAAWEMNTGARALRSILERAVEHHRYRYGRSGTRRIREITITSRSLEEALSGKGGIR